MELVIVKIIVDLDPNLSSIEIPTSEAVKRNKHRYEHSKSDLVLFLFFPAIFSKESKTYKWVKKMHLAPKSICKIVYSTSFSDEPNSLDTAKQCCLLNIN